MKHDLVARMVAEAMKPLSDRMAEIEAFIADHKASHDAQRTATATLLMEEHALPKRRKVKDDEDGA
jgi:hypothetical protein